MAPRLRALANSSTIKGFRKGKAPPHVVREVYGGRLREEALDKLMRVRLSEELKERELNPVGPPQVDSLRELPDQAVEFSAVFEVWPEIGDADFTKIKVDKLMPRPPTDEDVERVLGDLRLRHAEWEPVDRAARVGDRVSLVFSGRDLDSDEDVFGERPALAIVGKTELPNGLERRLEGMGAGDDYSGEENWGEEGESGDFAAAAARKVLLNMRVDKVEKANLPAVDKEFFKACGSAAEDASEFKDVLRRQIEGQAVAESERRLKDDLFERLQDEYVDLPLPRVMVDEEVRGMRERARGAADSSPAADVGTDGDDMQNIPDSWKDAAERRIRLGLVVGHLVEKFSLEVKMEEIRGAVDDMVAPYGDQARQLAELYYANDEIKASVRRPTPGKTSGRTAPGGGESGGESGRLRRIAAAPASGRRMKRY